GPSWSSLLTVDSSVRNVNAAGEDRVNFQAADEGALTSIRGITPVIAKAIAAARGQNRLETLADLLDVVAAENAQRPQINSGANQTGPGQPAPIAPPQNPINAAGPKLISEELLMDIADDLTADSNPNLPGVVNINTASLEVLACLPGAGRELAQAVILFRQSNGFFPN